VATPVSVVVDVTGRVPIEGEHHVTTWVFVPERREGPVPLLFCLPGGTYTKAYWHLEVPGRSGYSFAGHMAAKGMLVVAVDHLGTGESSRHLRAVELTPDVVAGANAAALSDVLKRAGDGTLAGTGPIDLSRTVGVGHSMGAMLAIFQQSLYGGFDAIASLGYGTIGPIVDWADGGPPSHEAIMALARSGALDEPFMADRAMPPMRRHFYWDDVPDDVIAADDLSNTHVPGVCGPLSIVPFIASDHAGRVTCPVFVGLGERDSTSSHYDEPRAYRSSQDVTLFVLPRSAHCHNSAGTRHRLWDRLAAWIAAVELSDASRVAG
jgi:pimeloyl-ACP methyl ester carboxylesterase